MNAAYGLNQKHHFYRLCHKRQYNDLSNHIRQYHGLVSPVGCIIARAVEAKIPITKRLFPNDLQVTDPYRSFLCPLHSDCESPYHLSAVSLRTHLIDVHDISPPMADLKIRKLKNFNKKKNIPGIERIAFQIAKNLEAVCEIINIFVNQLRMSVKQMEKMQEIKINSFCFYQKK